MSVAQPRGDHALALSAAGLSTMLRLAPPLLPARPAGPVNLLNTQPPRGAA